MGVDRGNNCQKFLKSNYWDCRVSGLQVTNANDKTIELRALMSAGDSPTAWNLRCEVREKLLRFLQNEFPDCLPKARIELENNEQSENVKNGSSLRQV